MTINFASSSLRTEIFCHTVSVDGFEVGNLISDDSRCHAAGFLAEAFVVPPVHITLSFPCAIDVDKVIVNGQLSSQKSIGFQVFTAVSGKSSVSIDRFDSQIFCPVARCSVTSQSLVCFTNSRYKTRVEMSSKGPDVGGAHHERLYHHVDKYLSHVKALTLSITRTANGSAVAVKTLEVWGQPAFGTPNDVVCELKWRSAMPILSTPSSPPPETSESHDSVDTDAVGVPPEFMDSITCELMSVPILLPCGMSVDRATLDRHISSEKEWGRPPSDPFTGRSFSENYKPVAHTSLKARVDKFFVDNADCLVSLPRVVRSNGSSGFVSSRLVPLYELASSSECDNKKQPVECVTSVGASMPALSTEVESEESSQRSMARHDTSQPLNSPIVKHVACCSVPSRSSTTSRTASNTPDKKRIKLTDETIKAVGVNKHSTGGRLESLGCSKCNELVNLYRLPCSHHVCRQCLLCASRCQVCDIPFLTSDPVRVHY